MGRPAKPVEQKRLIGNPGKRPLPDEKVVMSLPGGYVAPLRPLEADGQSLWDAIFLKGELWISNRTDIHFMQMVCEQHDRRQFIMAALQLDPSNWHLMKQLNDLEIIIATNMGKLGLTPSDRTRLGYAEVKRRSKLEELQDKWGNRELAS
jgi:hypothetical protein